MRLDRERAFRSGSALEGAGAGTDRKTMPRTQVVRELLLHALNHFARSRGEDVPTAEPVTPEEMEAIPAPPEAEQCEVTIVPEHLEVPQALQADLTIGAAVYDLSDLATSESKDEILVTPVPAHGGGPGWIGQNVRVLGLGTDE